MQTLLNICDQYSNDHDLIYNSKKTMCMCFTPKSCKSHECKLSLNQESLSYVREARYLGVVIQSSGTDKDVHRQMRKYYAGINTLIRRFYACSYDVKCYLFRSYISNMYCGQFWFNSTKYCLNKLRVSYNNSCRRLLGLPMMNSASGMFVQCNLLSSTSKTNTQVKITWYGKQYNQLDRAMAKGQETTGSCGWRGF